MRCEPINIIRPAKGHNETVYERGDTSDIIRVIMRADKDATGYITDNVECLRGSTDRETFRNVYFFIKNNIKYRADRPGLEQVKSPGALFSSKIGDCKSFSIAIVAILRALGYNNIAYRFAAYGPGDYTHVYPIVKSNGDTYILDAVTNTAFDKEAAYSKKKDITAAMSAAVSGVHGSHVRGGVSNFITMAGLLVGGYFLFNYLQK
jgi:hypothetical protein